MKLTFLTVILASLMAAFAWAAPLPATEPSVAGMWAQVDEKGRVGGWFLIFEHDGVYEGAIAKMFFEPGEDTNPICTRCTGDQKNAPSLGLVIIKGMQRKGLVYQNGSPSSIRAMAKSITPRLTLSPDGQQLTLRGYLGFEVFGQNQIWRRLPNDVDAARRDAGKLGAVLARTAEIVRRDDDEGRGPPHTGSVKSSQPSR